MSFVERFIMLPMSFVERLIMLPMSSLWRATIGGLTVYFNHDAYKK